MVDDKKNMVDEIEHDIHEQFAKNMNEHVKSFISFIATIIVVFGIFFYTYQMLAPEILQNNHVCKNCNIPNFIQLDSLVWAFIISLVVLCFLCYICFHLGWSERRDQFVIAKIRYKRYEKENNYDSIFKSFEPNKGDPLPNYYKYFIVFFCVLAIIMFMMVLYRLFTIVKLCNCCKGLLAIISFLVLVVFFVFVIMKCCNISKKYKETCEDYLKFKNEIKK